MSKEQKYALAIHGGAGTILKEHMTSEKEAAYHKALEAALKAGEYILKRNGSAIDAVTEAVACLEDSDLFNAGKGSVFTNNEDHELEASIMDGKTKNAGAICAVKHIKNPVRLSRRILDDNEFVFLAGEGAEEYAVKNGFSLVSNDYFFSDFRYEQLKSVKNEGTMKLDHDSDKKFGTVGAVAIDKEGNIAGATSTGGLTNKKYGRIGDSPVIGSGVYADNNACAISCTGYGEYFLRAVTAYDIAAIMQYKEVSLQEAADKVIMEKMVELGGEGGIIGIDGKGNIVFSFNCEGMYRGKVTEGLPAETMIYKNNS
ncbi:isoaspartyl peptidase/L-asparaginase family protein [Marinigracilibium pacificum]|uniref:Isoaspartyl peptidase n=1 Tax=Marinigracilibium pacificum TaxID=2729599 RepID=A0A848J788_9BACT|nr:isoaspartyl peptidase/L-asparaginase [Marinigracilibium pacificum]NMM48972.1 isoaspartyl peptidase/L-asparaginase [Marinigracilibium pacificum]